MRIKALQDTNFQDYKECSMLIGTAFCSWKCGKENCHNHPLENVEILEMDDDFLVERYLHNEMTSSVIVAGLEPFDQWPELQHFVQCLRGRSDDVLVIYTGYNYDEVVTYVEWLKQYPNIIIKFGRYIADQKPHYDEVLGVNLASDNQYAIKIS